MGCSRGGQWLSGPSKDEGPQWACHCFYSWCFHYYYLHHQHHHHRCHHHHQQQQNHHHHHIFCKLFLFLFIILPIHFRQTTIEIDILNARAKEADEREFWVSKMDDDVHALVMRVILICSVIWMQPHHCYLLMFSMSRDLVKPSETSSWICRVYREINRHLIFFNRF